jgi:hypothetical protein
MLSVCRAPILVFLCITNVISFETSVGEFLDTLRLLLSKTEMCPDDFKKYRGINEGFAIWQQHICPQYYKKPLEERVDIAIRFSKSHVQTGPIVVRRAVSENDIPRQAVYMRNGDNETLLHAVGKSIGYFTRQVVLKSCLDIEILRVLKERLAGTIRLLPHHMTAPNSKRLAAYLTRIG